MLLVEVYMLSEEQQIRKSANVLKAARYFLKYGGSMVEVAKALNMSSSSVQRYLNDEQTIKEYLGEECFNEIQGKLLKNKKEGLVRGGKNSTQNNEFTKDELGKFTGSRKK
jgi:DNA-binding phage protein